MIQTRWFRLLAYFSRIIVGIVFVFSGFVKAIDPMGSAYKFEEYFAAFGLLFLKDLSLLFSIGLSAAEFIVGGMLLVGIFPILASWGAMLFMAFFTPLTLYLAIKNPVTDCGCFGDAIKMTNWETFYKNIVIIAFTFVVFLYKKHFTEWFRKTIRVILTLFVIFVPIAVAIWGLLYEPMIDFRPWKVGASLKIDTTFEDKYYVTYRNKQTGETKEYLSPNFPWNDAEWLEQWEFVGQRVETAPFPETYFLISDEHGNDFFKDFTQHDDFQFILIMHSIETANLKNIEHIKTFARQAAEEHLSFIAVTGSTPRQVEEFVNQYKINFEIYYSDETTLKTIVRTNPALLVLYDGIIIAKWSHRSIPEFNLQKFQHLAHRRKAAAQT